MPKLTRLGEMTWKEVDSYLLESDGLIVPIGSCEQHGYHLPLSCDTLIAEAFAERIGESTGLPLAPTMPYGVNLPCDRFMAGTSGFSFDSLSVTVRDLFSDWIRHGFRRFFIVTAHGCATDGYGFAHHEALKQGVLPFLENGEAQVYILFPYWTDIRDLLGKQTSVEHACEVETSLALHLFPDEVRTELADARSGGGDEPRFRAFPEGVATGAPEAGFTGAEGYPASASREKGKLIFERCLGPMVEAVVSRMSPDRARSGG